MDSQKKITDFWFEISLKELSSFRKAHLDKQFLTQTLLKGIKSTVLEQIERKHPARPFFSIVSKFSDVEQ